MKRTVGVLWVVLAMLLVLVPADAQGAREAYVLTVDGAISSATADYISRGIELAGREGAHAVVVLLNTPGGDVTAMLKIMETLENAEVPVVVYVWPRGGMAASAGALITLAASGAAMAPHTTIGAAHPVAVGDVETDGEAIEKLVNVLVEHAGAFAARRGEAAVEWAERAIRESETANEQEALDLGLIDVVAGVSFVLFFLDLKTPGVEALTFVDVGTLIAGALVLFNVPAGSPYGKVSVPLVVATGLVIGAFFALVMAKALRAQRLQPLTGTEVLVGRQAVVRSLLDPEGTVWVAGELWTAVADDGPLALDERVEVVAVERLRLRVWRSPGDES